MAETANVEILIDAFTEAAEQAFEDVGEGLTELAADAQPAKSAMDETADQMDEATSAAFLLGQAFEDARGDAGLLAGALHLVSNRADEAGDELLTAGGKASVSSGLFSALTVSTEGLNFAIGSLSTTLSVALVPAMAALATTVFPLAAVFGTVAAAAGGLAAAFGLIVGSGIVAGFSKLKDEIKSTKLALDGIISGFGKKFVPLLEEAINAIPDLVGNILDAVGGLQVFVDVLEQLGGMAFRAIPQIVAALVNLGRKALPLVIDAAKWLMQNGGRIFRSMVQTARQVAPALMRLLDAFIQAVPALTRVGTVVLTTVVPALSSFLTILRALISGEWQVLKKRLGTTDRGINALVAGFRSLMKGIKALMPLFRAVISDFQDHAIPAIGGLINLVGKLAQAFGSLPLAAQKAALVALLAVIGVLAGPITTIIAGLSIMAIVFDDVQQAVQNAMKAFRQVSNFLEKGFVTSVNVVLSKVNGLIRRLNALIKLLNIIPGVDLPTLDTMELKKGGFTERDVRAGLTTSAAERRRAAGLATAGDQRVTLDVKGESPLADFIRQQTQAEVERNERSKTRRSRRQNATGVSR